MNAEAVSNANAPVNESTDLSVNEPVNEPDDLEPKFERRKTVAEERQTRLLIFILGTLVLLLCISLWFVVNRLVDEVGKSSNQLNVIKTYMVAQKASADLQYDIVVHNSERVRDAQDRIQKECATRKTGY